MNKKTQKTIAKKAGISQGYLSKIMAGKANPTIKTLQDISKASGMSVSYLLRLSQKESAA